MDGNKSVRTLAFTCSLILALSSPAWAMRTRVHEAAESPQYKRKFGGMLGRGLLNGVTCFVDPIVNIVNETRNGPPLVGTLTGVGKGLGCGVLRLGSGVIDVGTFWVPGFNGFPVSDSYENCLAGSDASSSGSMLDHQPSSVYVTPQSSSGYAEPEPVARPSSPEPAAEHNWKK